MRPLSKKEQEFFDRLKRDLKKKDVRYLYGITHTMNKEEHVVYVTAMVNPEVLAGIMAYIEHVTFDLTSSMSYSFSEEEILEIVNRFYTSITYLDNPPTSDYYEIDLYYNWAYHSDLPYQEVMGEELHRDGLLEYVQEMAVKNNW